MIKYKRLEWTSEQVSKFWDYESKFPENYFSKQVGNNLAAYIKNSFPDKKTVLDFGCGPGFLMEYLIEKDFQVAGLEFSKESLQIVNQKLSGNPNFSGAFEFDSLISQHLKFDIITLVEVIEHLNDFILNSTFMNIKKLLSDDGVLIITTPNNEDIEKSMVYCPNCDSIFHRWQHLRSWSLYSLSEYLISNKFSLVKVFTTDIGRILSVQENISEPIYISSFYKRVRTYVYRLLKHTLNYFNSNVSNAEPPIISYNEPHLVAVVQLVKEVCVE